MNRSESHDWTRGLLALLALVSAACTSPTSPDPGPEAAGFDAPAPDPITEWWKPPAGAPPAYECCEDKLRLGDDDDEKKVTITADGKTGRVNAGTQQRLQVLLSVPIHFHCNLLRNSPTCYGYFAVTVKTEPKQKDASEQFTLAPTEKSVATNWLTGKCDNGNYKGTIKVLYDATYPTNREIKGTLRLDLTLVGKSGSINHSVEVDVNASGSSANVSKPRLKALP